MFLLRPAARVKDYTSASFTFQYVSIKTKKSRIPLPGIISFTFQYVSIKTAIDDLTRGWQNNLHSNMFLLRLLFCPLRQQGVFNGLSPSGKGIGL